MLAALSLLIANPNITGLSRTFPDGTKITLLALTSLATKKSYTPGGAQIKDFIAPASLKKFGLGPLAAAKAPKGKSAYVLVFRLEPAHPGEPPSLGFKSGKGMLENSFVLPYEKGPGWWVGAEFRATKDRDVSVGLGLGRWASTSTHDLQTGITKGPKFFAGILRDVNLDGKLISAVDSTLPASLGLGFATRIKLYDLQARSPQFLGLGPIRKGSGSRWLFVESGQRIIKAELQTRPYRWVSFPGVRTPGS